jgi:predicted ABC-type ATPase
VLNKSQENKKGGLLLATTKELHSENGIYKPYRSRLHKKIVDEYVRSFPSQEQPEIFFMGGGTASGKSTIRDIHLEEHYKAEEVIIIDCDEVKKRIPEYQRLNKRTKETAASLVHQESSDINNVILAYALEHRFHIAFDGTMKDYEYYYKLINEIKERGYLVFAVIIYVPLEIAFEREAIRGEIEEEGRRVPRWAIIDSHGKVAESFGRLKAIFDAYWLWDNSGDFLDAKVILRKEYGAEEVIECCNLVEQFFKKQG